LEAAKEEHMKLSSELTKYFIADNVTVLKYVSPPTQNAAVRDYYCQYVENISEAMMLSTVSCPMKSHLAACLTALKMALGMHRRIHAKQLSTCAKKDPSCVAMEVLHTMGVCHKCQQGRKNMIIRKVWWILGI